MLSLLASFTGVVAYVVHHIGCSPVQQRLH